METKLCTCGKKMIKRYSNIVLMSYPPQTPWSWWCGGCEATERGGVERGMTEEEMNKQQWENAQKPSNFIDC